MYAFLSTEHSHNHTCFRLAFFCHRKRKEEESFLLGKIMGIFHPLFRNCNSLARERQRWEKLDVTTVESKSLFSQPLAEARRKKGREIESIGKSFSSLGFWQ
jgi:hypothetical protein